MEAKQRGPGRSRSAAAGAGPSTADGPDEAVEHRFGPDVLQDSLGYAIKRAQVRTYEQLFATLGPDAISPARMTALFIIGAQPGINQSSLAERLRVTRASMVKVIDNLEQLGLVERCSIPGDRRSYALELTVPGQAELRTLHEKTREYEKRIAEKLSPGERRQLIQLLEKVAARD